MNFSKAIALFALAGLVSVANAALADGGAKFLGNITTGGQIRSDMGTYWNQITAENGCKWGSIHSLSNGNSGTSKFAWDNYDKCEGAYKWAKEKPGERHFKFHALVWGSQYPSFLCKKKNPGITVELTKQYITEWFDAVAAKFPDLEYIDVVNEAIYSGNNYHSGYQLPAGGAEGVSTDDANCGGSYIIEALGGDRVVNGKHQYDFITTAFKMARERWPKAVLIYNDYNTLHWQKNEGIELVQTIIKNGAPVDAYGQQAHDAGDFPDASSWAKVLTEVHDAVQIPLFITEYDIGEADDQKQKNIIANQIPFLWETEWIAGITIWGYINGSTWRKNTGIMNSDGSDRASMKWLKEYFSQHLADGKNTTGFGGGTTVEPEPQKPFRGVAFDILADRIEAEDFDIPGTGSGNNSYYDSDSGNNGGSSYREGTGVDIKDDIGSNLHAIGWNATGDWLEYTINVPEEGEYTLFAAVSGEGGQLQFSLDGTDIGDLLTVSKSNAEPSDQEVDESIYGDFFKVKTNVTLPAGEHILRMTVVQQWFDLDYFNFVKGANAEDNAPVGTEAIASNIHMNTPHLVEYDLIDIHGARLGHFSAYSLNEAIVNARNSKAVKSMGVYYLRSRTTGKIHSFRVVK
jgi:GH35 family endo-1,4-beta-xylanase